MRPAVRLHVPRHMLENGAAQVPKFYRRILSDLEGAGARTEILHRDQDRLRRGAAGGHFDLVHNGGVDRVQVLNMAPAYLGGFWYADPRGIYFESTITDLAFRPRAVPAERAAAFVAGLRNRWVTPRRSRHEQPEARESFGTGHIAVFLQDWSDPVERARYMTADAMVDTVLAGAGGREVVIKPHPRNIGEETQLLLHRLRGRRGLRVTTANIHDILPGAAASVSISSSVALEGMLHGVPAILFGRSDLHHCAETVRQPADWGPALARALSHPWPFEAFLWWFLRRRNLEAMRPVLPRLLRRMADQGADLPALKLPLPPAEGAANPV